MKWQTGRWDKEKGETETEILWEEEDNYKKWGRDREMKRKTDEET